VRRFRQQKTARDIRIALRELAREAAKRFPYYGHLMSNAGVSPRELQSIEALRRLPITTKSDVLTKLWEGFSPRRLSLRDRVEWSTSGTSGPLLFIHMSHVESIYRTLSYFRAVQEHASFSWPLAIAFVGAGQEKPNRRGAVLERLARVQITRILHMLPEKELVARLLKTRPQIITGTPIRLGRVAVRMVMAKAVMRPKLVVCRGEMLDAETRSLLGEAFHAKVVDFYNAEEIGTIASECPVDHEKMHVNTDCCILEVVDDRGNPVPIGTEGRAIVTNLFNHTMPFLRYDLGDRATLLSTGDECCACGSNRPSMLPPSGRADDSFTFASGISLSPGSVQSLVAPPLLHALAQERIAVRGSPSYQIIQTSESRIRLLVTNRLTSRDDVQKGIEASFRDKGISVAVTIEEVDEIPIPESGKPKRVISKVRPAV
jgi:phenylacetate-coenzyme A ligase PaaK-like adenylate-forming protein